MSKATRAKATGSEHVHSESAPAVYSPALPSRVDPILNASLVSTISTQIAQDFSAMRSDGDAAPSTSATSRAGHDEQRRRKRQPSSPTDDPVDQDSDQDSDTSEAIFDRRARSEATKRKKGTMSLRMAYGELGKGLSQATINTICSNDYIPPRYLRRSHS